jgi:uncharacterized membrane protein YidH (DUF202 family)
MSAPQFIFTVMGAVLILIGVATAVLEMLTKRRDHARGDFRFRDVLHSISLQSIVMMVLGAAVIAAVTFVPD